MINASEAPLPAGLFSILVACDGSVASTRAAEFSAQLAAPVATGKIHPLHLQPHCVVAGSVFAARRIDVFPMTWAEQALATARAAIAGGAADCDVHAMLNDVPGGAILRAASNLDCSCSAMGRADWAPLKDCCWVLSQSRL